MTAVSERAEPINLREIERRSEDYRDIGDCRVQADVLDLLGLVREARRILLAEGSVPFGQTEADKAAWLAKARDGGAGG